MSGKTDIDYWALRRWGVKDTTALKMVGITWTDVEEDLSELE